MNLADRELLEFLMSRFRWREFLGTDTDRASGHHCQRHWDIRNSGDSLSAKFIGQSVFRLHRSAESGLEDDLQLLRSGHDFHQSAELLHDSGTQQQRARHAVDSARPGRNRLESFPGMELSVQQQWKPDAARHRQ